MKIFTLIMTLLISINAFALDCKVSTPDSDLQCLVDGQTLNYQSRDSLGVSDLADQLSKIDESNTTFLVGINCQIVGQNEGFKNENFISCNGYSGKIFFYSEAFLENLPSKGTDSLIFSDE